MWVCRHLVPRSQCRRRSHAAIVRASRLSRLDDRSSDELELSFKVVSTWIGSSLILLDEGDLRLYIHYTRARDDDEKMSRRCKEQDVVRSEREVAKQ
jgi:hypothetical protein